MRKLKLFMATLALTLGGVGSVCAQESGTKYYLYNEDSGLFLSRGAAWGTHATGDTYGIAFEFTNTTAFEFKFLASPKTLKNIYSSFE